MTTISAAWYDDFEYWVLDKRTSDPAVDHEPDSGSFVIEVRDELWTIYDDARTMMESAYEAIVAEAGLSTDSGALSAVCGAFNPDLEMVARAAALYSPGLKNFVRCRTCGQYQSDHAGADVSLDGRRCRSCGCTEFEPCVTGNIPCHWVAPDLCSACA